MDFYTHLDALKTWPQVWLVCLNQEMADWMRNKESHTEGEGLLSMRENQTHNSKAKWQLQQSLTR